MDESPLAMDESVGVKTGRTLTQEMIFMRTKCNRMELIKHLNLWGNELQDISVIRHMPNLEVLSLSVNRVNSLADLQSCPKLAELYLRKNEIADLSQILHLQHLQHMKVIWLADNPCASVPIYRQYLLHHLPGLTKIDSQDVTDAERLSARDAEFGDLQLCGGDEEEGYSDVADEPDTHQAQRNDARYEDRGLRRGGGFDPAWDGADRAPFGEDGGGPAWMANQSNGLQELLATREAMEREQSEAAAVYEEEERLLYEQELLERRHVERQARQAMERQAQADASVSYDEERQLPALQRRRSNDHRNFGSAHPDTSSRAYDERFDDFGLHGAASRQSGTPDTMVSHPSYGGERSSAGGSPPTPAEAWATRSPQGQPQAHRTPRTGSMRSNNSDSQTDQNYASPSGITSASASAEARRQPQPLDRGGHGSGMMQSRRHSDNTRTGGQTPQSLSSSNRRHSDDVRPGAGRGSPSSPPVSPPVPRTGSNGGFSARSVEQQQRGGSAGGSGRASGSMSGSKQLPSTFRLFPGGSGQASGVGSGNHQRPLPSHCEADERAAGRADNILCAVLALIKELDGQGLELVRRAVEQRGTEM